MYWIMWILNCGILQMDTIIVEVRDLDFSGSCLCIKGILIVNKI